MFHIDYSYIVGDNPPFDSPPISISPGMEDAYKAVGIWKKFVEFSKDAFTSLRGRGHDIIHLARLIFPKAELKADDVEQFLRGSSSLNLGESDQAAAKSIEKQIRESTKNLKTWLKMAAHETIVPVWYKVLQDGNPPAQAAMDLYNKYMEKRKEQLAEVKVDIDDASILEIN